MDMPGATLSGDRYVVDDPASKTVTVTVTPQDNGAKVIYDGAEVTGVPPAFTVDVSRGGTQEISYTVTSQDGSQQQTYNVKVEQRLDFTAYVRIKWNAVMVINLQLVRIEAYSPSACRWYRNGEPEPVGTGFTYSKQTDRIETDRFVAGETYHFEIETPEGIVRSADYTIPVRTSSATLMAYPNPARAGEPVYLSLGAEEESDDWTDEMLREAGVSRSDFPTEGIENALIRVYTSDGRLVLQQRAEGDRTELRLPKAGLYIIRVNEQTTKVVISN
jgi:hypothetical protein